MTAADYTLAAMNAVCVCGHRAAEHAGGADECCHVGPDRVTIDCDCDAFKAPPPTETTATAEAQPENGETTHLWDIDHPYYCNEGNYHRNGQHLEWGDWADFMTGWGDSDEDMNLVFRWDWKKADPDDYEPGEELPGDKVLIFVLLQRKGDFWSHEVAVTEADEPAVRTWLEHRAKTIAALWAPLAVSL